ncbi:hypothetical protein TNCV_1149521 [Trichonephila clavipes]|nr:hypothetical protein TNCV_1149521 [Trichonephila clavipes]
MRQAWHLPQRWHWSIVLQVRDVIRQFTQGTPNPKATVFGIPKEPVLESSELITSRLTGAGSFMPPIYGEAWAKGHATRTPDSTFPRYGSPHTANMRSSRDGSNTIYVCDPCRVFAYKCDAKDWQSLRASLSEVTLLEVAPAVSVSSKSS